MPELALGGGKPIRTADSWPKWPIFGNEERELLLSTFDSGRWWHGERVAEFEQRFAEFQTAGYGISCTNGTAALEMALIANGVGAGDEVIVPPYTFVATASAVLKVNAIPVFADIDYASDNIDPEQVRRAVTPRTKAIMPVHFAGLPCHMDALGEIAREHDLKIIEDACHSWGTRWKGKGTGTLGTCGAFSFQMSKNITGGEGGIVVSDSEEVADAARSYSNCGRGKDTPWYAHYTLGDNLRMTELQAAILLGQLGRLEEQTNHREKNAAILDSGLAEISGLLLPPRHPGVTRRSYHIYLFKLDEEVWGISRETFLAALNAEGVPCSAGYPTPVYRNPLFSRTGTGPAYCPLSCPYYEGSQDYSSLSLPNAEKACATDVWIRHAMLLAEEEDMHDLVRGVRKVWEHRDELR